MLRSILLPTLFASFIAVPMLYQQSMQHQPVGRTGSGVGYSNGDSNDANFYLANRPSYPQSNGALGNDYSGQVPLASAFNSRPPVNTGPGSTALGSSNRSMFPASTQQTLIGGPAVYSQPAYSQSVYSQPNTGGPNGTLVSSSVTLPSASGGLGVLAPAGAGIDFSQMTPDYGAVETRTFRGNAYGPDLTAEPMQFVPVSNFQEVFRFDVSPDWVKQRWDRLTAIPAQDGLHGLRTALVTGTNSWDLNGSLTYFFDQNHRIQRIGFRGWVGDPSRLANLATGHFGLKPRPTHWAGLYLAEFGGNPTGVLLMKDPGTIDRRNQVQRTAVIMEINQPSGGFKLSEEALGFVKSAIPGS